MTCGAIRLTTNILTLGCAWIAPARTRRRRLWLASMRNILALGCWYRCQVASVRNVLALGSCGTRQSRWAAMGRDPVGNVLAMGSVCAYKSGLAFISISVGD